MRKPTLGNKIPRRRATSRRAQRGMALITTVSLMLLMSVAAVSVLGLVGALMTSAQRRMEATEAFNIADAGADLGRMWLSQKTPQVGTITSAQLAWAGTTSFYGTNGTITDPFNTGSTGTTLTVRIDADISNTDTTQTQKRYLVESRAVLPSGITQTVRAYVQQTSFGHYAVFVDSNPGNAYWSNDMHVFDGPVHSNNSDGGSPPQPNGAPNNILWHSEAGAAPIFTYNAPDAFTVSASSVTYWKDSYYNVSAPTTETDWKKIAVAGSAGIRTGTPMISFPPPGSQRWQQHDAALGSASVPSSTGVVVSPDGGIYIHCKNSSSAATPSPVPNNDVQTMTLSVDNHGNQVIQVAQTDDNGQPYTTTLTLNKSAQTTQVHVDYYRQAGHSGNYHPQHSDTTVSGGTNGVVYCDGNIGLQNGADGSTGNGSAAKTGGLSGTIADHQALTIATDPGDPTNTSHPAKNCNINGNILTNTPRQKFQAGDTLPSGYNIGDYKPEALDTGNFKTQAGTLGIVSNNVEVTRYSDLAKTQEITNIETDAATLAYGTFDACDYSNRTLGKMLNMGSYLVGMRGIFGTPSNGIPCSRLYDNRLGNTPPPFFPTTGSQYEVVSWQRSSGLL